MRILPGYEKSVLEALKNGPKPRNILIKELCPKIMSEKKLQTTLNELEEERRIFCRPMRIGKSHKWTSVYALPIHQHLLEADYSQVARAVKHLRLELCRNPEVEEVAAKIGEDPENVRKLVFKHASELRWKPPSPEEKEEAKKLRQKAWELAAQIKYSLDNEIDTSEISMEDIKRATFLLKHQLNSIKLKHLPIRGVVLGPGFPTPSPPRERGKKEIIEAIKRLRGLKKD